MLVNWAKSDILSHQRISEDRFEEVPFGTVLGKKGTAKCRLGLMGKLGET